MPVGSRWHALHRSALAPLSLPTLLCCFQCLSPDPSICGAPTRGCQADVKPRRDIFAARAGSEDKTVRAWALDTGACLQIYQGHFSAVRCMQVLSYLDVARRQDDSDADATTKPTPRSAPIAGGILCTAACDLRVWDLDSGDVLEVMAQRRCDALGMVGPLLLAAFQGAVRSFSCLPARPPTTLTGLKPSPVLLPHVAATKQEPGTKARERSDASVQHKPAAQEIPPHTLEALLDK